jgi:toxin FitB
VILLDTNVVSALMRRHDDPQVVGWLRSQPNESVWTTAVTVFEIRSGLEELVAGRRRTQLEAAFTSTLSEDLDRRVLPFDVLAAQAAGAIYASRRRAGRPMEFRDAQIAGIAAARRATLATRNVRHFADLGIALVDPWSG